MPLSEGPFVLAAPRGIGQVLAGDCKVFRREPAAEGIPRIHRA